MEIKTIEFAGLRAALHGMRNPMDSWAKSDTVYHLTTDDYPEEEIPTTIDFTIGEKDKDLSKRLQEAGPEHAKHLRMIMVWVDITAPRYWWNEFDTYRAGVEKVSCSTMHKLTARPLRMDDFEHDCLMDEHLEHFIDLANVSIAGIKDELGRKTNEEKKKILWRGLIQGLPQSYLQKRTVMMSYAALRNIYRQRKGHKLKEWQTFREWVESLPESWMIIDA